MREDTAHWPRCLLWHGWLPMLSGTNRGSLGLLMLLRLPVTWWKLPWGVILLICFVDGVPLMVMMRLRLLLLYLITPMSGLMVALCWIGLLVFLLLVLFFFPILAGVVLGLILIVFVLTVLYFLVEVSALFQGLCSCSGRAFLPGPPGICESEWLHAPSSAVSAEDVAHWPYSVSLLVKWVSFLGTLHWPVGGLDLGVGGISYVELLLLYELWAGQRLSLERAVHRYLRHGRPISVSAVPFGPGIDIWRSCRVIGAMMRSLCFLPGGLRRFVPCSIGVNHCRLRHIEWEKFGHGLTSRPRTR